MTRAAALLALTLAMGCAASGGGESSSPQEADFSIDAIAGIEWRLERVEMKETAFMAIAGSTATFACSPNGEVTGMASINRYSGRVFAEKDRILGWGPIRTTRMAGPPELMAQEDRFLEALPQTVRIYLFGERLVLENRERGIRLEFTR